MSTNLTPAVYEGGVTLTTSTVVYITGAVNSQYVIKRAVFTNTTNVATTFTVTRTPSGGSAFTLIPARSITGPGTDLAPELANMVLLPGDEISAFASANASINMFATGWTAT